MEQKITTKKNYKDRSTATINKKMVDCMVFRSVSTIIVSLIANFNYLFTLNLWKKPKKKLL